LTEVIVSPTGYIGPYAEDFIITPGNASELSTSVMVYNLLAGPEVTFTTLPHQQHGREIISTFLLFST
jgi:hypothetical protein